MPMEKTGIKPSRNVKVKRSSVGGAMDGYNQNVLYTQVKLSESK